MGVGVNDQRDRALLFCFVLFFSFGRTHSTWKFPGQGWNSQNSDRSCCRDNAGSLTPCAIGEIPSIVLNR